MLWQSQSQRRARTPAHGRISRRADRNRAQHGNYGEQLKWTFSVLDKGRNLVAYSTFSPSLA
jgi:hypothetical protein